jgi:outer membrane protein
MKRFFFAMIIGMILILSGCATSRVEKIGIMDMNRILQESQRAGELQQELLSIGDELEERYNQAAEKGQEELDKIYQEYLDNKGRLEHKLNEEINIIVDEITEEQNIDIVLIKEQVYYGGIDITGQIINRLDEEGENNAE